MASVVLAVMATGCVSPAEIAAADKRTCAGYGFAEGSDGFANCMMQADQSRQRAEQQRLQVQMQQQQQAQQHRQTESYRPWHERCTSLSSSVTVGGATSSVSDSVCSGR